MQLPGSDERHRRHRPLQGGAQCVWRFLLENGRHHVGVKDDGLHEESGDVRFPVLPDPLEEFRLLVVFE